MSEKMMSRGGMQEGMTRHNPKPFDASTGPKAVSSGKVNDSPTRNSAPTVTAPGPRSA